jgi:vacuolar-type H+-ATPase subunit I/STV1
LRDARQVYRFSPELAYAVRDGVESLDAALAKIVAERTKLDSKEAKFTRLRSGASDLAELVDEARMSLDDALAALDDRDRKTRSVIDAGHRAAQSGITDYLANVAAIAAAVQLGERDLVSDDRLKAVIEATDNLKQVLRRRE